MHLMEGEIEVTSATGAGSVFRFHLPVRVLEAATTLPPLPPKKVAIVSANTRARDHYARLLEGWGLRVMACENIAALPPAREHDVLVVDVPTKDAARWPALLREQATLQAVPVVGLVDVSVPPALRDELRGCFRTLLKKPLRDTLAHAVLQSLLRH
jgi:BarA-like signal transduction histidine kinase